MGTLRADGVCWGNEMHREVALGGGMQQRGIVTCCAHMSPLRHNATTRSSATASALLPRFAFVSSLAPPPLSNCQRLPIQTSCRNLRVAQPAGLNHPNPDFMSEFEGGTTRRPRPSAVHRACHNPSPLLALLPELVVLGDLHSLSLFYDLVLDHNGIRYPDVSSMYPLLLPKDRAEEERHKLSQGMHILVYIEWNTPTGWPRPSPPDGVLLVLAGWTNTSMFGLPITFAVQDSSSEMSHLSFVELQL
ncbi:hypothetical protein DFH08DRAFT_822627 [Mycena albidolilacea]|uniref:Uncharacterized protein n=1 Tax=Mycena albidolilacea TaxID=1033008 RepID=A0AAD6Z8K8_9AGAR|nr:hypothetical protein DFH08DRAFT_822627 [Mycena albidolilacea]